MAELAGIIHFRLFESEPYSPVGWSKCMGCGYKKRCWDQATSNEDPAILVGIDQGLAIALKNQGLSITGLLNTYDKKTLSDLRRPWGKSAQKVGKKAGNILQAAKAHLEGSEIWLSTPDLPVSNNFVMFDLEGLPPYVDGTDKVYLWGMQVFGTEPSDFIYSLSDKGEDGDRKGWFSFLSKARQLMEQYPGIKFVHWAIYERVKIKLYSQRFGDPDGIAQQVLENLFDLLTETQKSVILPIPSYSLKEVEKYVGFKRTQEEYGGDWSIAQYMVAVEIEDKEERNQYLEGVLIYNREDLAATWSVFDWLKRESVSSRMQVQPA